MNLIIVESPTKAKTLGRFLGNGYQITASMGHVRDLPKKKLGIDIEHDFKPAYEVNADKQGKVDELKKAAKNATSVVLATDPDREGEAIAWHLETLINKKLQRIVFHEITESAIKEALNHPRAIDMNLVDAQQARRILDRLVGYKLSPLLWRKIRRGLSAGRVQSVAVRLIVEREREIQAFKPVEYWEVLAHLKHHNGDFQAKLVAEIHSKEEADKATNDLNQATYIVKDVQSRDVKRSPYPPFTTSTMQQAASNFYGWSAKKTMQVAQSLYEAGFITYHRTDSTNLAVEAVNKTRQYIESTYGQKYLPEGARFYKTKSKVAQEAHEAIRPTNVAASVEVDRDQKRLYELVWKRFVACQMADALYRQISVDVIASAAKQSLMLRANGNEILFEGWKKLFGKEEGSPRGEAGDEENKIPELAVNDKLDLIELLPTQHFTEPPPRYTEASLIKVLEEHGIGRPSTYAPIISTIQERNYVERQEKKLLPTALGIAVNDFLLTNFPNIMDYQFTAGMEDNLDAIANGEKKWVPVLAEFYQPFEKILDDVGKTAARVKIEVETTDEICPECGSPLIVRIGKFGKFLACNNFPNCKFTKTYVQKLGVNCPKCGGDVILKKTKNKRNFYGCSNYPKCDFASWTKPKVATV